MLQKNGGEIRLGDVIEGAATEDDGRLAYWVQFLVPADHACTCIDGEFLPGPPRAGKPSIRSNLLAILCAFDSRPEALKVVGRTVGELEEFFDHGTGEDGDLEPAEFLDDAGKVKQPKRLRRQGGFLYLLYVTTQLCGMRFSGA